ncbi:MAG: hypothetical protein QM743_01160 [Chitinophagaceae bacterium]
MKRIMLICSSLILGTGAVSAQTNSEPNSEITKRNSWLKVGLNAGMPLGDASDWSNFTGGVDVSGQFMVTNHFGLGLSTGYNHFFAKAPFSDFGTIPANLLLRYYPKEKGFFAGVDGGYTFYTNVTGETGGFNVKPELGYHNYNWNFYAYYNHIFGSAPMIDIQTVGIAASYNIRFR